MVSSGRLKIMQVTETGRIRMSEEERQVRVTVINSIKFSSIQVLLDVVFHYWTLASSGILGSCRVYCSAVSEGKDVFEPLVLECIGVNVD